MPKFHLTWDIASLASALKISEDETRLYFTDGRRISFLLERRLRDSFPGWKLAHSEGAGYDLVDENGVFWEVRSLSKNIYFCPSYMVGSGRRFEENGFFRKIESIGGYICSDITKFPKIPIYVVHSETIRSLYIEGNLGANTLISRNKFYKLIVPLLNSAG